MPLFTLLFEFPVTLLFEADKVQILLLIDKQKQEKQYNGRNCGVDVRHIKNRKIDAYEINKVYHIIIPHPVDHIADGTCHDQTE